VKPNRYPGLFAAAGFAAFIIALSVPDSRLRAEAVTLPLEVEVAVLAAAAVDSSDAQPVAIARAEAVTWSDGCLGVLTPGVACTLALVEGYVAWVTAGTQGYRYHTNLDGSSVLLGATIDADVISTSPLPEGALPRAIDVGVIRGSIPTPGSIGLLVLLDTTPPEAITSELLAGGCAVESLATLQEETWHIWIPGAPAPINAAFPASTLGPLTPFFVRCAAVAPQPASTVEPTAPSQLMYFETLPPGSELPSGAECAQLVHQAPEVRSNNTVYNQTRGFGDQLPIDGASDAFQQEYSARVDGDFVGTTDEIIQWASCKWGFDEDISRAKAWTESAWRQWLGGDSTSSSSSCSRIGMIAPCDQSWGLMQVKGTVHEGTYPRARVSTAFNLDYALAWQRACLEGDFTWLTDTGAEQSGEYRAGELWGCLGAWFSGTWNTAGSTEYQDRAWGNLQSRPWEDLQ
jgi:autotransporter family porin